MRDVPMMRFRSGKEKAMKVEGVFEFVSGRKIEKDGKSFYCINIMQDERVNTIFTNSANPEEFLLGDKVTCTFDVVMTSNGYRVFLTGMRSAL